MPVSSRLEAVIDSIAEAKIADVHTCIPCKVTAVNRGTAYISAQPLLMARYELGFPQSYPELKNIPPMVISDGQKANIKMPLKVGATVLVFFSEKDASSFKYSSGTAETVGDNQANHGLFPIGWMVNPTVSRGYTISETDIVIENDKASVTMTPTSMKLATAGGSSELQASGNLVTNGATIDTSGNITTASGVSLDAFYAEFKAHTHNVTGVQSGSSTVVSQVPN